MDDARYVIDLVRTAAGYGAHVASRTQVTGFLREGERVTGVRATDLETGNEVEIRAQQVVNATGVWTDEIQEMVGGRGSINVRASKGVHLVVPRDRIHSTTGIILRTPVSVLFVIPWGRHWIIGTTDTDWSLDKAHPAASRADIDYVLGQLNRILAVPLTRDDVEGVYAGLRPLLAGESESTSKLSREHTVVAPGARPGHDRGRQVHHLPAHGPRRGRRRRARPGRQGRPSCTDSVPLAGADGFIALWNSRHALARSSGLHVARIEHLLHRYGSHDQRGAGRSSPPIQASASRWQAPMTTCAPRSSTRRRTRAPGTWTTCWRGVPMSRSRPGTAGCPRPRRRRP